MVSTPSEKSLFRSVAAAVRGASSEGLEALRADIESRRQEVIEGRRAVDRERPSAPASQGASDAESLSAAARCVRDLCDVVIALGAVETASLALEEGHPCVLQAGSARRRALSDLAACATDDVRDLLLSWRDAIPEDAVRAPPDHPRGPGTVDPAEERAARLTGDELEAALNDVHAWPVAALAERLAEVGRAAEVQTFLARWAGPGWSSACGLLRAAVHAPDLLSEAARQAVEALPPEKRGRLCGENPRAAVAVLGPERTLELADGAGDEMGQYVRIVALSRVAASLPAPLAERAARLALEAFSIDPDTDALGEMVRCAPFMPRAGAASLLFDHLGHVATPPTLGAAFNGYGGIGAFAPLIKRCGGDEALVAAAEAVKAATGDT